MKTAPILASEVERLKEVLESEILNSPPEIDFDEITHLAAAICQTPIALVTIIGAEKQWFKSKVGIDIDGTAREESFCGHAIWKDEIMVVENATLDERFQGNPLTMGENPVIFYAGAPLRTKSGHGLGTLCVVDHKPRVLTPTQLESLRILSRNVSRLIELKKQNQILKSLTEEIHRKELALAESAKLAAIGQMAAGVAHEINTPLAIISLLATQAETLMKSKQVDPVKVLGVSDKIQHTVDRISKIVRGLLDISRDGSKDAFAQVKADSVVEATLAFCVEKFRVNGIILKYHANSMLELQCRHIEISQVILNLLNNSLDAMMTANSPQKEIEILVSKKGENIEFSITDSGPGISHAIQHKVFDPFFSTKDPGKGTGLGLSVSKKIVESHGGRIFLSPTENGTCFVIQLPQVQGIVAQIKSSAS